MDKNSTVFITIAQGLLAGMCAPEKVTMSEINGAISSADSVYPIEKNGVDIKAIRKELIRRYSFWIGNDRTITNDEGHVAWLSIGLKTDWRYWHRYRQLLEKKLAWSAIESLDKTTDKVLGALEDPNRSDSWDRRGLVVGHVQSGKTSHYTGLICKAADAGYRIIVVLAGLHNNLRSQTQIRLEEGFLGYFKDDNNWITTGVGELDSDVELRPHCPTTRANNGDFRKTIAGHTVAPEEKPWLFVVKKNKTVLTQLLSWIKSSVADTVDPETGERKVSYRSLLVIDDEADSASVDTGEQLYNGEGQPDLEYEPKTINRLTRQLLNCFDRKAYVGYTATPFANIFIHEHSETKKEGKDLFPSAFIMNLPSSSNYVGPNEVFGLSSLAEDGGRSGGLPLIKSINDHIDVEEPKRSWLPPRHKNGFKPYSERESGIPASLEQAVQVFVLSCVIRDLRGQVNQHSSMLIHVTRFTSVQADVASQVDSYVSDIKRRLVRKIGGSDILRSFYDLWKNEFSPVSERLNETFKDDNTDVFSWEVVAARLIDVLEQIDVKEVNGTSKDVLDYERAPTGIKVIAIGGDKLARGLTLEGLTVSYFLRASKMYDTLMQMGRWFGYRPDYLDLCRLYITDELWEWFEHITDAADQLREEFDLMIDSGSSPKDYGLKVQSHPSLMITSPLKMRSAKTMHLSYSGCVSETVSFSLSEQVRGSNLTALTGLVSNMGNAVSIPKRDRVGSVESWKGGYWSQVSYEHILEFLDSYSTHPSSIKADSKLLMAFIEQMAEKHGELKNWNVAIIGGSSSKVVEIQGVMDPINCAKRKKRGEHLDRYSFGRLLSPKDEGIDTGNEVWLQALDITKQHWTDTKGSTIGSSPKVPSGLSIRYVKGSLSVNDGLLMLYLLDPSEAGLDQSKAPFVGFGMSFPTSEYGTKVEYKVNNVYWTGELGGEI